MSLLQAHGFAATTRPITDDAIEKIMQEMRGMTHQQKTRLGLDDRVVMTEAEFVALLARIDYAERTNVRLITWKSGRHHLKYAALVRGDMIVVRVCGEDPRDDFYGQLIGQPFDVVSSDERVKNAVEKSWAAVGGMNPANNVLLHMSSFDLIIELPPKHLDMLACAMWDY